MKPSLLILAAGLGSRYGGLKQIDSVGPCGEYLLDYAIFDARKAGFGKIVFLITKAMETEFKAIISSRYSGHIPIEYAFQELDKLPPGYSVPQSRVKPWGTAHAIMVSEEVILEPFTVINADDYYGPASYAMMCEALKNMNNSAKEFCMVGFRADKTLSAYGKVSRGVCAIAGGYLHSIVEREDLQLVDNRIVYKNRDGSSGDIEPHTIVSMNFWGFTPQTLFSTLKEQFNDFLRANIDNPKAEFYIPSAVDYAIRTNKATVKVLESAEAWFGMTYKQDKPIVIDNIRKKIELGVYPERLF